ncbi:hypothetical protein GQ53DRAFT_822771 [Thozetella sp. PMI_491]|nr:hypothetical protein GQ53DRAFT_822771 [Thozetella sp. PMI_491]
MADPVAPSSEGETESHAPLQVEAAVAAQPEPPRSPYPTHHLRDIDIDDDGVQLILWSKDHQFQVEKVHGSKRAFQCFGAMEDETIKEIVKVAQRSSDPANDPTLNNLKATKSSEAPDPAKLYGPGRPLGETKK